MTQPVLSLLIADDDEGDRKQIMRAIKQAGMPFDCIETSSIEEALKVCSEHVFDCAFIDYRLPGQNGLHGISALHELYPYMGIIMATGQGDAIVATEAMKRGALDYIAKANITPESIRRISDNAVEKAKLQRKVTEQQEELEKFAHVLVHDLKAPIRAVLGFAQIMERTLTEGQFDINVVVGDCRGVLSAAIRMAALIDTLQKYTSASEQIVFESTDMQTILEDALSNLETLIRQRSAHITHGNLPIVNGNAAELIQLAQNLIGNAIKYCEAGVPEIHVAAELKDDAWVFSIKDNGIGIEERFCKTVFEPFRRLHGVGKYEGTGLGLAICRKIIERHGGGIWCESQLGQGATFFFTLPKPQNHA